MISDIDGNFHEVDIQPAVITAQCQLEGFALIADTVCTEPGTIVCVDIKVNDFEDIIALQFSINWDSTVFVFDHLEGFNLPGLDDGSFGVPENPDVNEGELTISWIDLSLEGVTVPDLSSIFTLCLRAIGPAGSSTPITFSEDPLEIEIATLDSVLVYGLLHGQADIQLDCEGCTFSYTLTATHPTCPGQTNGSLNLSVDTGNCPGTPTFAWSHGPLTEDVSGLAAGVYSVTITLNDQIVVATETIEDPTPIGVNGTITNPVPAGGNNGAINITVTGGMPPYSFLWSHNNAVTEDLNNIPAGVYTVTITDSKGCVFVPDPFIVGADLSAIVNHVTCPGACNGSLTATPSFGNSPYTYVWNTVPVQTTATISNLCPGSYCVTVTESGGDSRDTCFTITEPPVLVVTANITHDVNENGQGAIDLNVTGGTNPITYLWSNGATTQDLINLDADEYCVTITFGQGCTFDTCFTIFAGNIGLSLTATQYGGFQTSCHDICDGEITSVVSGASGNITYAWSNGATTPDLMNLCPGIYSLTITDETGNSSSATRVITAPPALSYTAIVTFPSDITASDGAISIIATGGVPNYTYEWVGPVTGNSASMNNLPFGTYRITVFDANGCEFVDHVDLTNIPGLECYQATSIITPNDDGKNDVFIITCTFDADNRLSIFNRQGGMVYQTNNYANTWTGVDGDNEPLPDGGYMWVLEIEQNDGTIRILKGTVNLLRTAD